ncbi:hypothetical protein [Streptomyces sp. NBC_00467]|uniref:hypothetical protein n=1 Tax=Streptomyces sp. NBC_00467 TaxID=2975752 RepID=UPI003FA7BA04
MKPFRWGPRLGHAGNVPRAGVRCADLDVPERLFAWTNSVIDEMPHYGRARCCA